METLGGGKKSRMRDFCLQMGGGKWEKGITGDGGTYTREKVVFSPPFGRKAQSGSAMKKKL